MHAYFLLVPTTYLTHANVGNISIVYLIPHPICNIRPRLSRVFPCFSGFMYAYVCYLSEECPACLVMLTADRESFHALSQAKTKITEVSDR